MVDSYVEGRTVGLAAKWRSRFFGPYLPIVLLYVWGLPILTVSRLGLALWKFDRIQTSGISWNTFFMQGVRADIIQISLLSVPLVFLSIVLSSQLTWKVWRVFSYVWVIACILFLVFLEVSTPSFISQYDFRPNRLYIEYLAYPKEVFATIWNKFRFSFILGVGVTLLITWLSAKTNCFWLFESRRWSYLKQLCILPVVIVLVGIGARSTMDHRPANPSLFALTGDPLVNSLIINSSWSVFYAIYNLKHEGRSSDVYGKMDIDEMLKTTGLWRDEERAQSKFPINRFHAASVVRDNPLNLVIVLEESLGATFVESLGGVPATPELEKLKGDGMWFENLYATGTRSVRGIEAVVSGFLPTRSRSVVKLSLSQNNFFTIASLLKRKGYFTEFIYGGESHFDNMRTFFTGNGFESVIDENDYENPRFYGTWGVSDEDLFEKADDRLMALHKRGESFFSLVFTSSNHSPFEYPEGRIELLDENPATAANAVKYADYAMGKFFEKAKTRPYWENTVFLVVADHDIRAYGSDLVPVNNFHIPGLILGAGIKPEVIRSVVSQIDLPTTLLSLIGVSADYPMVGRDISLEDPELPGRAFMQFADNYCMMEGDDVVILTPEKEPSYGTYDRTNKSLLMKDTENVEFARRALAYSQLPSWLYRKLLYGNKTE